MIKYLRQVAALVAKDLTAELRGKEMLSTLLIFAFLVIPIFAFSFNPSRRTTQEVFPGIIWVAFTFAGMLGLGRSFKAEQENDCLHGVMLAPLDHTVIYFAKVLDNMALMIIMEAVSLPLFFVFFDYRLQGSLGALLAVLFLGTFGFTAVGTFLAALTANTRTSELLLPLILFPIIIPVLLGSVQASALALAGRPWVEMASWVRMLAVYDVIFLAAPFLLFDYVLEV